MGARCLCCSVEGSLRRREIKATTKWRINHKYVEKFISYSSVQAKRGLWRSILAERMEFAKFLIANTYNVNADRVKDIFLSAWDKSYKRLSVTKVCKTTKFKRVGFI